MLVEEVVVLVSNDVVLSTRDDSADGALFGCPSFRREVGSVGGRWDFWAVGVFGHDGKGVGSVCLAPPQKYLSFVLKWL
jgi:hypothetical protein